VTSRMALQANKTLEQEQKHEAYYDSCLALAAFVAPALADQPNGTPWVLKSDVQTNGAWADGTKTLQNTVAQGTAQIIQNGGAVSGNCDCGIDQTTDPLGRSDVVQGVQAADGRGRDAVK
jgi:hypothetical protein